MMLHEQRCKETSWQSAGRQSIPGLGCMLPLYFVTVHGQRSPLRQCLDCRLWLTNSLADVVSFCVFSLQYFLTGQQQNLLDHERRLTADHMRRLNQVLAGHLSYLEVSKVHAERENLLAAAPSHGSAVGYASSLDGEEDSKGPPGRASPRQAIFRRLVRSAEDPKEKSNLQLPNQSILPMSNTVPCRYCVRSPIVRGTVVETTLNDPVLVPQFSTNAGTPSTYFRKPTVSQISRRRSHFEHVTARSPRTSPPPPICCVDHRLSHLYINVVSLPGCTCCQRAHQGGVKQGVVSYVAVLRLGCCSHSNG